MIWWHPAERLAGMRALGYQLRGHERIRRLAIIQKAITSHTCCRHFAYSDIRRSSNTTVLLNEIDDAPAAVALLDVCEGERRDFGSSQPATQKNCADCAIAQSANRRDVGRAQQRLSLPLREPVSNADACRFDADPLGQLWGQQSVVCRLGGQLWGSPTFE